MAQNRARPPQRQPRAHLPAAATPPAASAVATPLPTRDPPRRGHARREAREPPGRGRGLRCPAPRRRQRRRPPRGPPSLHSTHFVLRLCPNPHQQVEPQLKFPSPFREREPLLLAAEASLEEEGQSSGAANREQRC